MAEGVARHGEGQWAKILADTEFRNILKGRSNVDIKDKWRNLAKKNTTGQQKQRVVGVTHTPPTGSSGSGSSSTRHKRHNHTSEVD